MIILKFNQLLDKEDQIRYQMNILLLLVLHIVGKGENICGKFPVGKWTGKREKCPTLIQAIWGPKLSFMVKSNDQKFLIKTQLKFIFFNIITDWIKNNPFSLIATFPGVFPLSGGNFIYLFIFQFSGRNLKHGKCATLITRY